MASLARSKRGKCEQETGICNCIVAVFQVMVACQSITFISGQGYLYPDTESQSQKILQDVSLFPRQQAPGVTSELHDKRLYSVSHSTSQIRIIRFEPPFLDFDTECVGMPKLRTVYIHNPNRERDLQLSSISARTSHFHSSFFEKKVVPPGGNTSFEVVFLARVIGNVENTLFINTLHGTFPYQVFGVGIPNPYRLRPYLGAKVPLNSSFSPLISMHNPTSQPLQVTEMYSSSGFLQLQLPNGQHEQNKDQWEIAPYETKEVIRAQFLGQVEANHTAFIRIKTAQTESLGFHILPVEVEVSSAPGIYSSAELLDFGTLRTQYDDPKTLPLFLLNSGDHEVVISSITLLMPNPAISIEFKPVKLKPSEATFTLIANISFSAVFAKTEADQRGILAVKTKEKSYATVEIPFTANLLDGTLGYDEDAALFHVSSPKDTAKTLRPISLTNIFSFPVILQNVSLASNAAKFFKVLDYRGPVILPPSSQDRPFSVEFDPQEFNVKTAEDGMGSVFYLYLQTNASTFSLPLHTYSGILLYKVLREDTKKIDFGIMGTLDKRQVLFALYNHNPTMITLSAMNSTLTNTEVRLVSLTQGSDKNLTEETDFKFENFNLPSNSCAVFEMTLSASEKEEEVIGAINIFTKFQEMRIPVMARVVVGTLTVKPEKVKFSPSFPGLTVHQALTITNTFAQVTEIESVHIKNGDKRFFYKQLKNQGLSLEPNKKARVGKIYFDARQSCKPDRCYVGLPTSTTIGHHWLTTLALGPDSVEFDVKRYKELRQRWKNLQNRGLTGPNTTLILDTDVVMNVEVAVQATLYWPTLLEETSFSFPLTHVGRKSEAVLTLVNPADSPVVVQVLPLSLYPQPDAALEAFGLSEKADDESFIIDNSSVFHLVDPRFDGARDSMTSQMVWLEYTLNGKLNHSVVNLFLDPAQRVSLKVEFIPYDDEAKSTVILLRNNLTILDALHMHGRGAYEHLTLGGKSPNQQNSILRFKLTKEILKDCARRSKAKSNPSFTVRKWFHANNTGLLPIHITSVSVNGSPCEGYGFRVLDCDQFILQPNSSKKLEIAFTPDFTSFLVLHKLKLVTAQGNEMNFVLNVTLPPYMLPLCQEAVPRPSWEPALYCFIALVMMILFFGIILMSYLEAINIWEPFVRLYEVELQQREDAVSKRGPRQPTPEGFGKRFDLRNIATSFISTVTSNQQQKKAESTRKTTAAVSKKLSLTPSMTSASLTTSSLGTGGHCYDSRQDMSQQTDPHPDFPPLSKSYFSPTGLISRLIKPCMGAKDSRQTSEKSHVANSTQKSKVCQSDTMLHTANAPSDKKHKDYLKLFDSSGCVIPPDLTADVQPYAHLLAQHEPDRECEKIAAKETKKVAVKPVQTESKKTVQNDAHVKMEKPQTTEVSSSHEEIKNAAKEKRRTRTKSNRSSRASTSSSASADLPEPEIVQPKQPSTKDECDVVPLKQNRPVEIDKEPKPVRGKKLRKTKLSRKQIKAAQAKEREDSQITEEMAVAKSKDNNMREVKKAVEPQKDTGKKLKRQAKLRSASSSSENAQIKEVEKTARTLTKSMPTSSKLTDREKSPEPAAVCVPDVHTKPKRRSNSYSYENGRAKDKVAKITIYKNPHNNDSRSSSSQEISESSSSEGNTLWDTPSQQRDPDEDMRQLSKQTLKADMMMEDKRQQKERRHTKGATSPVHLTSSSRSSSYSSVISTASSNEGNPSKQYTNGSQSATGTPNKKLSRSSSDTTGGSNARPQLRKRAPYPPVSYDSSTVSPTHSMPKKEPFMHNAERISPKPVPPPVLPARTLSSPSLFTNLFGKNNQQNPDNSFTTEVAQQQWAYRNAINTSSYSAFGQTSLNFNLMGGTSNHNMPLVSSWNSPFSDNSSLYSSPSPQKNLDSSPTNSGSRSMRPRQWSSSGSPHHTSPYNNYDAPSGASTAGMGPLGNGPLGWGDIPSLTSGTSMTTHSIWSVSNAVTMDENRNADECDPLGVKSIWSNTRNSYHTNWRDPH